MFLIISCEAKIKKDVLNRKKYILFIITLKKRGDKPKQV